MNPVLGPRQFLAAVTLVALVLAGHLHWLPTAYAAWIGALLAAIAFHNRHTVTAAKVWLRIPLLFATLGVLFATVGSPIGREGGSALLGGLTVLKLFESRLRRDARVIVVAVLFFAMIGFLFEQGLVLTLYNGAVAMASFVLLYLIAIGEDAALPVDLKRGTAIAARIGAAALPLTVAAFVFFPRLSSPLWGAPWDATQGRTGISDRMRPGGLSQLWNDDTPVFRVTFRGAVPPPDARYWRGPVLWRFDGQEWRGAELYRADPPPQIEADTDTQVEYDVLMEPTEQSWWFPLDAALLAPPDTRTGGDGQVVAPRPLIAPMKATMRSAWRYRMDSAATAPGQRPMGLQLPDRGNPRARDLARQWRARHGNDERAIIDEALSLFHGSFSYTLEPPPLASDSVDDFLFNTRAGYCEYYASSFVFLMRSAGIPARVVTGYLGGMYNGAGDYWVIRNSDAHAWAEVWLPQRGWVRVDPTAAVAPERIDRGSIGAALPEAARWYDEGVAAFWRDRLDLVSRYWRQAVIEFNAVRQQNLLQQVGLEDWSWQALGVGLLAFGGIALALGAWWSLRGTARTPTDPLLAAWRRFTRRLARVGVTLEPSLGPIALGERAALRLPGQAPEIAELARRFAEQRYGESAHDRDATHRRTLARELRAFRIKR